MRKTTPMKLRRRAYRGVVHIQTGHHNTIITLTNVRGEVLCWSSAGSCGFKGKRKSTTFVPFGSPFKKKRYETFKRLLELFEEKAHLDFNTGPAHLGTLRIASSFKKVHAIMHAPLGDDYFNVMRSMLERERDFTPVTTSIVDRHVLAKGSKEKVVENLTRKDKEEHPDLILLTPTCTSSLLQEDLQNFVNRAS